MLYVVVPAVAPEWRPRCVLKKSGAQQPELSCEASHLFDRRIALHEGRGVDIAVAAPLLR